MSEKKQNEHQTKLFSPRLLLTSALVGVLTGLFVSAFRYGIVQISTWMKGLYVEAAGDPIIYFQVIFVLILFVVLISFSLKREPFIGGSGIPQVVGYLHDHISMRWYRVLFYKLFAGMIAIGSGLTVGREGPSVQIGASVGQGIGEMTSEDTEIRKLHTVAGACSGIAVAFNTPISSLVFAYEELRTKWGARHFVVLSLSVLVSNFFAGRLFGTSPIIELNLPAYEFRIVDYIWLLLAGVLIGLSGIFFNKSVLIGKAFYKKLPIPHVLKIALPFFITFLLIVYNIENFGSGEHFIFSPFENPRSVLAVAEAYIVSLILLLAAFCSGLPGGIFFPMLVLGSLFGHLFGLLLVQWGVASVEMVPIISTIGMAAHFAAIVRSPITGMLLVIEMTGAFTFTLPLVIVCFASYVTAECLKSEPIYESLLAQWMKTVSPSE